MPILEPGKDTPGFKGQNDYFCGPPAVGFTSGQIKRLVQHLREIAQVDYSQRITLESLDATHYETFVRAMKNLLGTKLALETFAQIIDGLPIADVAWDQRCHGLDPDHPLDGHEELCPGCIEKLVQAYRKAPEGSRAFNIRLIELVAVGIHQLGAEVFGMGFKLHQGDVDSIVNWTDGSPGVKPPPSLFRHPEYVDDYVYPEGAADIVGYWTEDRILGGVTVFDRRAEAAGEIPNIYIHSSRKRVTNRVFQLRDDQQQALLDFLLAPMPPESCPLPIRSDPSNSVRAGAPLAVWYLSLYRDIWERKPVSLKDMRAVAGRPREEVDYPIGRVLLDQINNSKIPFVGSDEEPAADQSPRGRQGFDVIFPPELPNSSMLDALLTGLGFPAPWQHGETFESSDEDEDDTLQKGDNIGSSDDKVLPSGSEGEDARPPNVIPEAPDQKRRRLA